MSDTNTKTLPDIDDFREVAAQRGEIIVDVDEDELEYPVSGKTVSDVDENPSPSYFTERRWDAELMHSVKSVFESHLRRIAGDLVRGRGMMNAKKQHVIVTLDDRHRGRVGRTPGYVAWLGNNAIVYDPKYDPRGEMVDHIRTDLGETALPIPWEAIQESGINPTSIEIVDQDRIGSTVFHDGNDYYYRGGGIHDGWVGRLDMRVRSVEEAEQEALKPDAVIAAENAGRDVVRQGDWFFVETDDGPTGVVRRPELEQPDHDDQLGNHIAEWQGIKIDHPPRVFVKGQVLHRNGDHRSVTFSEWREAINNGVDAYSFEVPQTLSFQRLEELGIESQRAHRQAGVRGHRSVTDASTSVRYD